MPRRRNSYEWFKINIVHSKCIVCGKETTNLNMVCSNECLEKIRTCIHCGNRFSLSDLKEVEGRFYCTHCIQFYRYCDDCGKWYCKSYALSRTADGKYICNLCFDLNYSICYGCGQVFHNQELCLSISNNRNYCYPCRGNFVSHCNRCGEHYDVREGQNCACYRRNQLHGCYYWPKILFHSIGTKGPIIRVNNNYKNLYLGFELEVVFKKEEGRHEFIHWSRGLDPKERIIWLKVDGSLPEKIGCEIVSQPMTLDYHMNNEFWPIMVDKLTELEANSHDRRDCGLHIHINKSFLKNNEHPGAKILWFSHKFKTKLEKLGRRRFGQYCEPISNLVYKSRLYWSDFVEYNNQGPTKYCAINIGPGNTIEYRFPRGTLKLNTLFATLELADAITKYCKVTPSKKLLLSNWNDFKEYVTVKKNYAKLVEYIVERRV